MELMRHESIETTLRYYVGQNAMSTAAVLWKAHRAATNNTFDNSGPNQPSSRPASIDATPFGDADLESRPGRIRTYDQGIMSPLL